MGNAKFVVNRVTVNGDKVGILRVSPVSGSMASDYRRVRTSRINRIAQACQAINSKGFTTERSGVWTWDRYEKTCHSDTHEPSACTGELAMCLACHRWFCQREFEEDQLCASCLEIVDAQPYRVH